MIVAGAPLSTRMAVPEELSVRVSAAAGAMETVASGPVPTVLLNLRALMLKDCCSVVARVVGLPETASAEKKFTV